MKKVIYFDVETTGLDKNKNEIVQLAYVLEVDGEVKHQNSIWIKPNFPENIDEMALGIIGKTQEELMQGMDSKEAYRIFIQDLSKFCDKFSKTDKYYPAGYNVNFDIDFLSEFFKRNNDVYLGSWINWKIIDPLPIVRFLDFKGKLNLVNYKLETVCNHFKIEIKAHDALSDILATRELIKFFLSANP